jgi:hypothetical protein
VVHNIVVAHGALLLDGILGGISSCGHGQQR